MPPLPPSVRRRIVGTLAILATALALMTAAAAVPARADDRDLARALAAVAVLALIAATVGGDRPRNDGSYGLRARLPAQCAVDLRYRRGGVVYAEPCLRRSGVTGPLPRQCAASVRIHDRRVPVFPQDCLIAAGFRPPRGYGG